MLSSIPVVGNIFRYKKNNVSNIVRVFLIQPREVSESNYYDTENYKPLLNQNEVMAATKAANNSGEGVILNDDQSLISFLDK